MCHIKECNDPKYRVGKDRKIRSQPRIVFVPDSSGKSCTNCNGSRKEFRPENETIELLKALFKLLLCINKEVRR